MEDQYESILEKIKTVTFEAGKIIKEASEQKETCNTGYEVKNASLTDLVTKTDKTVEEFLYNNLKKLFPDFLFIGEEGTALKAKKVTLTNAPTWIIDPLDGTTNFIHSFPIFGISIALVVNKEPVIGLIHFPLYNETYWGIKNKGSFKNGKKLPLIKNVSLKSLKECTIIAEYGVDRTPEIIQKKLETLKNLISYPIHGVRSFGCATYHLCLIASGIGDIFFEAGMHAWDIAAGSLIVKEAGGCSVGWRREEGLKEDVLIADEKLDLLGRKILSIRYVPEGKEKQSELLNEVRKRINDFSVESD